MSKKPKESLQHKVLSLIESAYCPGVSKYEHKGTEAAEGIIFSSQYKKSITTTAFDFVRFAKKECGCKTLADLPRAVPLFLESKADGCTAATLNKYSSELKKIGKIIGQDMSCSTAGLKPSAEVKRSIAMTPEDCKRILEAVPRTTSAGYKGLKLATLTGLRVDSIPWIKYEDVRANGTKLFIAHAKGGRQWIINLSPAAQEYIKELCADRKRGEYLISGEKRATTEALHKTFDRAAERAGITRYKDHNTAFHSIRKMWATETYLEKKSLLGERGAREYVLQELGHSKNRSELAAVYIMTK
jgi:integrase